MAPRKLNLHQAQVVEEVLAALYAQSGAQVILRYNIVGGEKVYIVESDSVSATGSTLKPLLDEFAQIFTRATVTDEQATEG